MTTSWRGNFMKDHMDSYDRAFTCTGAQGSPPLFPTWHVIRCRRQACPKNNGRKRIIVLLPSRAVTVKTVQAKERRVSREKSIMSTKGPLQAPWHSRHRQRTYHSWTPANQVECQWSICLFIADISRQYLILPPVSLPAYLTACCQLPYSASQAGHPSQRLSLPNKRAKETFDHQKERTNHPPGA